MLNHIAKTFYFAMFYDAVMYDNLPERFDEFRDVIETKYFCKRRKTNKNHKKIRKINLIL